MAVPPPGVITTLYHLMLQSWYQKLFNHWWTGCHHFFLTLEVTIASVWPLKNTLHHSFIIQKRHGENFLLSTFDKHDKTQFLAKFKKILYMGFRDILNFWNRSVKPLSSTWITSVFITICSLEILVCRESCHDLIQQFGSFACLLFCCRKNKNVIQQPR